LSPIVILWRVTEACNLACAFCEYRRTLARPRRAARAADVLAFGRVLGDFSRETGRPVLLSWLGGEPLLWPPLWEVSHTLRCEHGLRLSLTTNGARLTPAACRRLIDDFAEVTLSVDGHAPFHELVRGAPGLYPHLCAAAETLSALKSTVGSGPLLRANTVLMRSNIHALEDLANTLASWGIESLTFNILGGLPGDPFYERERLRPEHIAWLAAALPGLRARLAARGLTVLGADRYLRRLAHTALGLPLAVADCAPGQSFLFIDEAGRAAPCSFTSADYGLPITSLRSVADLQDLPARLAERRRAAPSSACADCHSTQVFGKFNA
jgi:MoaA/NifB/PqqE/SkfB family radical SAM enzyme